MRRKFRDLKFHREDHKNLTKFANWFEFCSVIGKSIFVAFSEYMYELYLKLYMRRHFLKCKISRCNPTRNFLLLVIFYQHWWSPIFILVKVPCYKLWTKNDKNVTRLLVILLNQISASCDMSRLVVFHRELCQPDVISARWYFIRIEIIVR